jgi:methylenetetrahydrofolate dehydrogenase (NADP+)/methenyltetrahydrofolate cyclohydrolase
MTATLLDGKAIAMRVRRDLTQILADTPDLRPHLVSIQVGDDQASSTYVRMQQRVARKVGIRFTELHLDDRTTQDELIEHVRALNLNRGTTGIIVQMPLPDEIDARRVQREIDPAKDVEGVTPPNLGALVLKSRRLPPCTPAAIMGLLLSTGIDLAGAEACVVGHSEIVGKPTALMLLDHLATVRVCHHGSRDLAMHTRTAEVLISATGRPALITGDMVKPGAIVIDVGFAQVPMLNDAGEPILTPVGDPQRRVVGDCDFDGVAKVAGQITPVPGGVGPLTTATLMRNTVLAAGGPELDLHI